MLCNSKVIERLAKVTLVERTAESAPADRTSPFWLLRYPLHYCEPTAESRNYVSDWESRLPRRYARGDCPVLRAKNLEK